MYRNTYRLTLESDPLSASSAAQDAYWLMLGDLMLDPARTSNVRREASNTRAQQEHERLSEQVGEALDKYSNSGGWRHTDKGIRLWTPQFENTCDAWSRSATS
jgi:hypothetical protein